jgi:hypothetical protein
MNNRRLSLEWLGAVVALLTKTAKALPNLRLCSFRLSGSQCFNVFLTYRGKVVVSMFYWGSFTFCILVWINSMLSVLINISKTSFSKGHPITGH